MLRWLVGITALTVGLSASGGVTGAPLGCGPAPSVECLATAVFSLAKTLPGDSYFRRHVEFAEQELAQGDSKTALQYVVADNPDAPSWEDIDWIARAGRFDRAIELAKQRTSPIDRLGGLLAVAMQMLEKNQTTRVSKIVDEVERDLPSIPAGENDEEAGTLRRDAGEIRARLGQTERAARLLGGFGAETVSLALSVAGKYAAAAGLRELAWREAERAGEPYVWQLVIEDAVARADQADIAQAGQRAVSSLEGRADSDRSDALTTLARALLNAGLPKLSARLVEPWPQWVDGKDATRQYNTLVQLIPVLVGLARDREVETATHVSGSGFERSRWLGLAADEYFRLGRSDVATKFDREALLAAASSPTGEQKLQWEHDAALHNLALARAGRGDIQGALDAATKLGEETKIREATAAIVARAIDDGQGPVVGPAIEALEGHARATGDSGAMLKAADGWYNLGNEESARRSLDEAMKMGAEPTARPEANDIGLTVELMWRINGKGEATAMLPIADELGVTDPSTIDHLVEIITPVSPAVAVQLAGRQTEVERQINELAAIGIAIAEQAK